MRWIVAALVAGLLTLAGCGTTVEDGSSPGGGAPVGTGKVADSWYGAWELRVLHAGAGSDPLVSAAEEVQRWIAAQVQRFGATGFVVVLVALVLLATGFPRRRAASNATTRSFTPDPQRVEERS